MKLSDKLYTVFTAEQIDALVPQQISLLNDAVNRVIKAEGDAALTRPRLEGIKELVIDHLWPPELTAAVEQRNAMKGFECLSPDFNLFRAEVNGAALNQFLRGIENWSTLYKIFPIVIGLKKANYLYMLFRNVQEDRSSTEITALGMAMAYDADELYICSSTDALNGRKAFLVMKTKTSEGGGVFFDLDPGNDKWVIGKPVGRIDLNTIEDFTGATAFRNFNSASERARKHEAQQSLMSWMPSYKWCFEDCD